MPPFSIAHFADDYAEARQRFLLAAGAAGLPLEHLHCPATGPAGEDLWTDVTWIGDRDAKRVLVIISGTHGVEGFCGSAFQTDWLVGGGPSRLPTGVAVLLIHAINPYGFAWLRRVTHEGVDLNRNFVDPQRPLPENPGYDEIADDLLPAALTGPVADQAAANLEAYRQRVGELAFFRAVASGQYRHPSGLFYGGTEPTWSNRTIHALIERHLRGRPDIAVVDFHTGLGPFGFGEVITAYPAGSAGSSRVRAFWGDSVVEIDKGQTPVGVRDGAMHHGFNRALPGSRVTFGTLEFGTYDRHVGRRSLRADHWLHRYGDPLGPLGDGIRKALRRQYYPATRDWKESVLFRGHQIVQMAIEGLEGRFAETHPLDEPGHPRPATLSCPYHEETPAHDS